MGDNFVIKCKHCGSEVSFQIVFVPFEKGQLMEIQIDSDNYISGIICHNCGNWEQEDMHKYSE